MGGFFYVLGLRSLELFSSTSLVYCTQPVIRDAGSRPDLLGPHALISALP